MLNVLAVRSPSLISNLATTISPCLPIGLAYIVASIEDLPITIEVVDPISAKPSIADVTPFRDSVSILGLTPEETIERIQRAPDVCLVSCMFSMEWPITQVLINGIKEKFPKCWIVGGGEHFSALPEYSLVHSDLDMCVLGEGEHTIREVMAHLTRTGMPPTTVEGTVTKDPASGAIMRTERRKRIEQLETIPHPAWKYFNVDGFLDKGISNTSSGTHSRRAFPICASRGCPYRCTFCSNPFMWGSLWKARSPDDVLKEMRLWIDRYRINHFDFCDLTAIVRKDWILQFAHLLIEERLGITWGLPSGTRSEALDEEVLMALKQSGCNDLDYAPESGSPTILKAMDKRITPERMLVSMRACSRVGINSKANIIFGYPQEKRRHILETYLFIIRMALAGVNDVIVTALSPYPGSKIFEEFQNSGKVMVDEQYFFRLSTQGSLDRSPCFSDYYSRTELQLFKYGGFAIFYAVSFIAHPVRLLVFLRDMCRWRGTTRLSMGLINILSRMWLRFARSV